MGVDEFSPPLFSESHHHCQCRNHHNHHHQSDIVCVVAADLPEKRGDVFRGAHGKIEAILGVEQRAGFAVDGLVRAEEPRCELLSLIVINPRVSKFLVQ